MMVKTQIDPCSGCDHKNCRSCVGQSNYNRKQIIRYSDRRYNNFYSQNDIIGLMNLVADNLKLVANVEGSPHNLLLEFRFIDPETQKTTNLMIDPEKFNASALETVEDYLARYFHRDHKTNIPKETAMLNIKNVIFNDPATIVFWTDGTKTVVKRGENDIFDPEKGLAMAIAKKALGNEGRYYETFKKWLPKEKSSYPSIVPVAGCESVEKTFRNRADDVVDFLCNLSIDSAISKVIQKDDD